MEERRAEVEDSQAEQGKLDDDNACGATHSSPVHATNMPFTNVPYTNVVENNEIKCKNEGEDIL